MCHYDLTMRPAAAIQRVLRWGMVLSIPLAAAPLNADVLDSASLAGQYFGADAAWYASNIPFLQISDSNIKDIYYYRWKVVNEHLHHVPDKWLWVMTEFTYPVSWENPDRTIDAAAGLHIKEGRWLRDPTYANDYAPASGPPAISPTTAWPTSPTSSSWRCTGTTAPARPCRWINCS
jgi:hypothetical protein